MVETLLIQAYKNMLTENERKKTFTTIVFCLYHQYVV